MIVKKTSQKQAIVADRIKSGEIRNERFRIEGIPPTDWRYDTNDPAVWSWTGGEDADDPDPESVVYDVAVWTGRECKENDLSDREAAKFVPFGKSWVNSRWSEIQDSEHADAVDKVEALTA